MFSDSVQYEPFDDKPPERPQIPRAGRRGWHQDATAPQLGRQSPGHGRATRRRTARSGARVLGGDHGVLQLGGVIYICVKFYGTWL